MIITYIGAFHYENHLYMKLGYTISRIFHEMSLSEFKSIHHQGTQILQSFALRVLKKTYAGYILSSDESIFLGYERNILCYYSSTEKSHHYMHLKIK